MLRLEVSYIAGTMEIDGLPEGIQVFQAGDDCPWNVMLHPTFLNNYPQGGVNFTRFVTAGFCVWVKFYFILYFLFFVFLSKKFLSWFFLKKTSILKNKIFIVCKFGSSFLHSSGLVFTSTHVAGNSKISRNLEVDLVAPAGLGLLFSE